MHNASYRSISFQIIYSTLNRLVRFVIPNKGGEIYRNVLIDKAVNAQETFKKLKLKCISTYIRRLFETKKKVFGLQSSLVFSKQWFYCVDTASQDETIGHFFFVQTSGRALSGSEIFHIEEFVDKERIFFFIAF